MEGGLRGIVIVFSAFMIQVLAFGNYSIVGIYTVHLLDEFDGDAVGVSLISAIHFAVLLGFGPITSFLMGLLSARTLCLVGAALVSTGIFCMPLLVYLPTMYLFFGVFAGLGGCLIYLPSHVLSGLYYDKYRSLAVGVATAGQGMGAILLPLIVGFLIDEFTWKGSLLILAGIDLHLFIFALLMIPPPANIPKHHSQEISVAAPVENHELEMDHVNGAKCNAENTRNGGLAHNHLFDKIEHGSVNKNTFKDYPVDDTECALLETFQGGSGPIFNKQPKRRTGSSSSSRSNTRLERRHSKRLSIYLEGRLHWQAIPDDDISNIFIPSYYSWWQGAAEQSESFNATGTLDEEHEDEETDVFLLPSANNSNALQSATDPTVIRRTAVEEMKKHVAILLNFKFVTYFISTFLWSMTTTLFLTFGPDFFVIRGHSDIEAAFLFVFYGIGQFFGCIIVSVLGSFVGKHRVLLFVVANVLTGILMSVVPFFIGFMEVAMLLTSLGLMYGGILGLYMIVMVDIVGVDDMDIGLGYTMLGSGIGCFIGPPIGGAMFQSFGSYDLSFYMAGCITVLAGLVMLLIYPLCQCNSSLKEERKTINP